MKLITVHMDRLTLFSCSVCVCCYHELLYFIPSFFFLVLELNWEVSQDVLIRPTFLVSCSSPSWCLSVWFSLCCPLQRRYLLQVEVGGRRRGRSEGGWASFMWMTTQWYIALVNYASLRRWSVFMTYHSCLVITYHLLIT